MSQYPLPIRRKKFLKVNSEIKNIGHESWEMGYNLFVQVIQGLSLPIDCKTSFDFV